MQHLQSPGEPTFMVWLARNPTGIPRASGAARAVLGTLLTGLVSVVVGRHLRPEVPLATLLVEHLAASAIGGMLSPLGVTALTYYLDRQLPRRDTLLGYSGVMRELLHAGELSALGALGAGLARSADRAPGTVASVVGTGALSGLLYGLRGFGPGLGVGAGLLSGLFGALLVAVARTAGAVRRGRRRPT